MIVVHELVSVKLEEMVHLFPKGRSSSSSCRVLPVRDICRTSNTTYNFEVLSRRISHISRHLIDGEALGGLSDQGTELRRVVTMFISYCHRSYNVGFDT
jgi:hypothetical protein